MKNKKILFSILIILFITTINAQYFELVKDIYPYSGGASHINDIVVINNKMYFTAVDTNGTELWTSDGTENGTIKLTGVNPGTYMTFKILFNNEIYFQADDGIHGIEIWKTDGTVTGTRLLKDINPNGSSDPNFKEYYAIINNLMVFGANDGVNGAEIWATDGTEQGTIMLNNLNGTDSSNPFDFIEFNGKLYYYSPVGSSFNIWETDGTPSGTSQVPNVPGCIANCSFGKLNNNLYFKGNSFTIGEEPWITDGTPTGTNLLKDIDPNNPNGSNPGFLQDANGLLFMWADDGIHGYELWATDGTELGTQLVKDFNGTPSGSSIYDEFIFNDIFYFTYSNDLWKSDGTAAGTIEVLDVNGNSISRSTIKDYEYVTYKDDLYFSTSLGVTKIDHITNEISLIRPEDQPYNDVDGQTRKMIVYNDALYFVARYNNKDYELWKYSDTPPVNTNLNEIDLKFPFKISPIPATNSISISATNLNLKQISIINSLGQKLLIGNKNIQNNIIDISQLSQGIYFLNIETEDGKLGIEKFIKN